MGATHTYVFEVSALTSATLAGLPTNVTTEQLKAAIVAAAVARGDLSGTSNASPPPADGGPDGGTDAPAGDAPAGDAPPGDAPAGDAPAGDAGGQ